MKLFDYECSDCGRKFEAYLNSDNDEIECPTKGCEGEPVRQLGGRPAVSPGGSEGKQRSGGNILDHFDVHCLGPGEFHEHNHYITPKRPHEHNNGKKDSN